MRKLLPILFALLTLTWTAGAVEVARNKPSDNKDALIQKLQSQTEMPSGKIEGFVHIPDQKSEVLIQPQGRSFRDFRNHVQPWIDAALIVLALLAMVAMYVFAGPMRVATDPQGRTVLRFTWFDRFIHWLTAVSFVWLAITGLNLVFGRALLERLIGDNSFAAWSMFAKLSHNSMGFAFMLGLFGMLVKWLHHNIPNRLDWQWMKTGGGMFGGAHPPARKFNAGQKSIFWISIIGGAAISVTGIGLLLPFYATGINGMQWVHGVHSVVAAVMIATIIGHVYLGVWGVSGSFSGMTSGLVDYNWAREHHGLWLEEEEVKAAQAALPRAAE